MATIIELHTPKEIDQEVKLMIEEGWRPMWPYHLAALDDLRRTEAYNRLTDKKFIK